ncbi:MAG: HK97 family phage prohead protease [Bacteroidaceae bacterium]|nr:HK97 family phage prohead protease [Bacteroidaceae bacterium]
MDKNREKQQRVLFQPTGMKIREGNDGQESRTVEGCAVVFNCETVLWDGKYTRHREIINPSCITEDFLKTQDVKLNMLHDREQTVARNNKGVGTLILDLRPDGLYFSAEMPKCDLGDRCLELIRNKTFTGCSFEFLEDEYTMAKNTLADGREDTLVTHTKFKRISALTIAMDPAYKDTSVGLREHFLLREDCREREIAEAKAREAQAKSKKEKTDLDRERELYLMGI